MLRADLLRLLLVCTLALSGVAAAQNRYEVQAGETIPLTASAETVDYLVHAKTRRIEIPGGGLTAGPNRAGDQILLGASLRVAPGDYTVPITATGPNGETREIPLAVTVKPRVTVPSSATRPPVVLLNGWETGFTGFCPVASSSSDTFGNLAQYLIADGVPVVYLFDNCLEDPNATIEQLGQDLGAFLNSIKYDNGTQVPQIDLVGFSLGGLIARSYLAGLQPNESLLSPVPTLVRDLVLLATPNFGSFVAGATGAGIVVGTQSAELVPGSAFLWNLATWNQRYDDLRGVTALAVVGNAGAYNSLAAASDGLVTLTSASGGFVMPTGAVTTRIVPYCHVDPFTFTNSSLGTFACSAGGIANVNSTSQQAGEIIRSFLAGTNTWQSIGTAAASDPYLSANGGIYFALENAAGSYLGDLTGVAFGTGASMINGGDTGTIYYIDFVHGTGALVAQSASVGPVNCGVYVVPVGYTSTVRCKLAMAIFTVGPLSGTQGKSINAGSAITLTGSGFGTQCSGCKVLATAAGSTTSQQLTVTAWSATSITANLPASLTGLVQLQVYAIAGTDAIAIIVIPQATLSATPASLQFAYTVSGGVPPAQSIQVANSGSGSLAWTATASASWISVTPASGTAPSTFSVSVSPAGMAAGSYTGTVQVTATGAAGSPASIGVTLTIAAAPPVLAVTPQALTFQYTNGGTVPAAQNIAIANAGGGSLAWTVSTTPTSVAGGYWLVASAASGTAPATLSISVNPVNLAAGSYTGSVQISSDGVSGSPATVAVTLVVTGAPPAPAITAIGNGASYLPPFASATWITIYGSNLSQSTYSWQASDFVNGQLPGSLQGVTVTIDGKPAYISYLSPTQINALAPDDAALGSVSVQVTVAQQSSNTLTGQKTQFAPAFFTFGGGYIAAEHADYSVVAKPNLFPGVVTQAAHPGETISLFATGFGPTSPALPTSQLVPTATTLANTVAVSIGGVNVSVPFAGLIGPGLYQINVVVPSLPNGDAAVMATIGSVSSQTGVLVTVQQ